MLTVNRVTVAGASMVGWAYSDLSSQISFIPIVGMNESGGRPPLGAFSVRIESLRNSEELKML